MRKSFVLHIDSLCVLDDLSDEQKGQLFNAIYQYQLGNEVVLSPLVKIAFSQFKQQFIRDDEKYQNVCESRKIAGSKGGKQKVANASKCKQNVANVADSDNKSDSDSKNKSDSKSSGTRLEHLSLDDKKELRMYMIELCEKENIDTVEIEKFADYWKSQSGKNGVKKDWYATFRNWCRSDWVKKKTNTSASESYHGLNTGGWSL
jgi:hypothetical protein